LKPLLLQPWVHCDELLRYAAATRNFSFEVGSLSKLFNICTSFDIQFLEQFGYKKSEKDASLTLESG
jgi:hypothetical protein